MQMAVAASILLSAIFISLSALHFYWAFGGTMAKEVTVPTRNDNTKVMSPGFAPTFLVALGLAGFGVTTLATAEIVIVPWPHEVTAYSLRAIAVIFALRAIGDFNYVGFFKKIRHTKFGKNDSAYYSPLCLLIVLLVVVVELGR